MTQGENIVQHILSNYYGVREVSGSESNPIISEWITRATEAVYDDSLIAWCSIFVANMLWELDYPTTMTLTARSWLEYGEIVEADNVCLGDIVILWRKSRHSWQGHVGFYIRGDETHIWILGGNQSNSVNIQKYPKHRWLGYRRIKINSDEV